MRICEPLETTIATFCRFFSFFGPCLGPIVHPCCCFTQTGRDFGSRLNGQVVGQRRHGKGAAGRCIGFERLRDGIADEFLDRLFHGARAKRLVNSAPDKELKSLFGDRQIKTLLSKSGEFLGNGKPANFTLRFRRKRFEDDFLVEASDRVPGGKIGEARKSRPARAW